MFDINIGNDDDGNDDDYDDEDDDVDDELFSKWQNGVDVIWNE